MSPENKLNNVKFEFSVLRATKYQHHIYGHGSIGKSGRDEFAHVKVYGWSGLKCNGQSSGALQKKQPGF